VAPGECNEGDSNRALTTLKPHRAPSDTSVSTIQRALDGGMMASEDRFEVFNRWLGYQPRLEAITDEEWLVLWYAAKEP
jgi:hypothetical protein